MAHYYGLYPRLEASAAVGRDGLEPALPRLDFCEPDPEQVWLTVEEVSDAMSMTIGNPFSEEFDSPKLRKPYHTGGQPGLVFDQLVHSAQEKPCFSRSALQCQSARYGLRGIAGTRSAWTDVPSLPLSILACSRSEEPA